jgi:hypothetical protein
MKLLESQFFFAKICSFGYLAICFVLLLLGSLQNPYWMAVLLFFSIPTIISFGLLFSFTYWLSLDKLINSSDALIFIDLGIHIILNFLILWFLGRLIGKVIYRIKNAGRIE